MEAQGHRWSSQKGPITPGRLVSKVKQKDEMNWTVFRRYQISRIILLLAVYIISY